MHESFWILRTAVYRCPVTQVPIQISSGGTFVNPARIAYIYDVFHFMFQTDNFQFELLNPDELLLKAKTCRYNINESTPKGNWARSQFEFDTIFTFLYISHGKIRFFNSWASQYSISA